MYDVLSLLLFFTVCIWFCTENVWIVMLHSKHFEYYRLCTISRNTECIVNIVIAGRLDMTGLVYLVFDNKQLRVIVLDVINRCCSHLQSQSYVLKQPFFSQHEL